jgi:hypothetical protein
VIGYLLAVAEFCTNGWVTNTWSTSLLILIPYKASHAVISRSIWSILDFLQLSYVDRVHYHMFLLRDFERPQPGSSKSTIYKTRLRLTLVPDDRKSGPRRRLDYRYYHCPGSLLLFAKTAVRVLEVIFSSFRHRQPLTSTQYSRSSALIRSLTVNAIDTGILTRLVALYFGSRATNVRESIL